MKVVKELFHFEPSKDGQARAYKTKVGVVFQRDTGSLVARIDYMPLRNTENGTWLELYNPFVKDPISNTVTPVPKKDKDEDMPF